MLDKDLEFLKKVDDKYLSVLVDVMINYDGGTSKIKAIKEECSKYGTSYQNYLDVIVDAYLNYGKDVFANVGSGIKISYRHVLSDVCSKLDVKFDANDTLVGNEQKVLKKALLKAFDDLNNDMLVDLISTTYAKPKRSLLKDWLVQTTIPVINCVCPLPLPTPLVYINPITRLIIDLYKKGKPEYKVTIPCTLLIALYRKMVKY